MERNDRVVVVGAGPVGLTAALVLARRGVDVCVLESAAGPGSRSHASTFHPPTLDILDALDVAPALIARGRRVSRVQHRDRDLGVLAEFDLSVLGSDTDHPFRLQVEQSEYTRLANGALAAEDRVTLRFETTVAGARTGAEGAEVLVDDGKIVHAAWVVAADGAASAIRGSLGLALEGTTYPIRYLTVKTSLALDRLLPDVAPVTYVSGGPDGVGLLSLVDHWRIVLRLAAGEDKPSPSGLQRRLAAAVSSDPGEFPVLDAFDYPVHRRLVGAFRRGRIVLAGDAAHLNSPTGGLGMNSGIHDAYALAHAIADVLDGGAPESAVDDVAEERWRVAQLVGARSERGQQEIIADRAQRAERARRLVALAADPVRARDHLRAASLIDAAPPLR